MTAATASADEILSFYAYKERLVRDRLQLVEFVLQEPGWNDKSHARYSRVVENSRKQLAILERRRLASLAIAKRRQSGAVAPPPLAVIAPAFLEDIDAGNVRFKAVPAEGVTIEALRWSLPTGQDALGDTVEFSTKNLSAGQHEVFLEAVGTPGGKSIASAVVSVKGAQPPALDVSVETIAVAAYPGDVGQELAGQTQLSVLVRNRGLQGVKNASLTLAIDKTQIEQIPIASLNAGERRAVTSNPLLATQLYSHELAATIVLPSGLDANPDNDTLITTIAEPNQAPVSDPPSSIAWQGPPVSTTPIRSPGLVLNDLVVETAALPFDLGPIDGFADLHNHQMANLGYDGRLIWGAHDGPSEEDAVPQCNGTNHALCWLPSIVADSVHQAEIGSHAGLASSVVAPFFPTGYCAPPAWVGGEFRITKGWHSNTSEDAFKHWPVWRTVTHQQVFSDWLESAHDQGLNLTVMSAVSFDLLCGMMRPRFADPAHPKYGTRQWACGNANLTNSGRRALQDAQGDWQTDGTDTTFDLTGFGRIDQLGAIVTDLSVNLGVDTVELEDSADTFVTMWERAFLTLPRGAGDPCLDRRYITNGPAVSGPERPGCLP